MVKTHKPLLTACIVVLIFAHQIVYPQNCGGGGAFVDHLVMLPDFQTVDVNTGERYTFEAYEFTTYVISFCQGGGSNNIDTQLEICDEDGTTVFAFNDDHCGLGSEITWTCDNTGTYSFVIHEYYCQDDGADAGILAYKTTTPPTEQDCLGAIPLCFDTYNTSTSYAGTGHYPNEIPEYGGSMSDDNCPDNCLLGGEVNDVWYTFTVQTSGTVSFVISPNDPDDDYDWAVYDITNDNCSDIYSNAGSMQVSCNFCGTAGDTGPDGSSTESCQHGDPASCTPFNDVLNVTAGETYVVNVSNWSATQSGYSINFGGTAQIIDNSAPELVDLLYQPVCGASNITVQMSERIWCVGTDPSDFVLTGPEGEYQIDDIWSEVCQAGLNSSYGDTYYDDVWTLELGDYLQHTGNYTLTLLDGGVDDVCQNSSLSSSINFYIDGVEATASELNGVTCASDTNGSATVDSVTGGTPPYTYLWSSGETTETATGLHGGTQYVTVTDSTGICSDVVEVDIPSPPPIDVDAGDDRIICEGTSTVIGGVPTASNGNPPYIYDWSPAAMVDNPASSNPTTSPTGDQMFVVIVEDIDGCLGADSVFIEIAPPMDINFDVTDALCHGDANGDATAVVTGGVAPFSYDWSHSLGSSETATGLQAGTTYTVTVVDSVGCVETADVEIGQPDEIQLNANVTDCDCGFSNGEIEVSPSGGTSPYAIAWETGDNTNVITGLTPGYYEVTVTDDHGCILSDSVLVAGIGTNDVVIEQTDDILCYGESTATLQADMPDGYLPLTFNWSGSVSTGPVASGLGAGVYSVTITDAYGCEGEESYEIEQPPVLGVNIIVSDVSCADANDDGEAEAIVNGGTPPYSYQWSSGDTASTATGLAQGSYSVTITDDNGCQVEDYFTVQMPDEPVRVYVDTRNVSCPGGSDGSASATAMGGTPPYQYIWHEDDNAIANGDSLPGLPAGDYAAEVVDDHGCTDITDFTLSQPPPIIIETAVQEVSCREYHDGEVAISVSGGTEPYQYKWSSGDTVPAIQDLESGNYYVTVKDFNDCVEMTNVYIPENDRLCLRIPNAFTPNGDGVNDTWDIEYINEYPSAHVMVYNRWGQKLYDAHAGDDPWDGTYNGKKCPAGAYTYVVDLNNDIEPFTGTVTVVY
ncbi:MAG: gliding motility-associated C-terminal domain-containing protein [Bacteroidales bacterium]